MARKTRTYAWEDPTASSRAAVAALWLNIAVLAASSLLGLAYGEASSYSDAVTTGPQITRSILDLAMVVALLASATIVFWLIRVSANAHALRPSLKISPAWGVIWYLIPIASLVKPFEAMEEIWKASSADYTAQDDRFLRIWWGLFLVNSLLGMSYAFSWDSFPLVPLAIASDTVGVALGAVGIILVRRLTNRQLVAKELSVFDEPGQL